MLRPLVSWLLGQDDSCAHETAASMVVLEPFDTEGLRV